MNQHASQFFFLQNYKLFDLQLLSIQWSYCEIRIILSPKFGGSFRISVFGKKTQWSLESGRCVLPHWIFAFKCYISPMSFRFGLEIAQKFFSGDALAKKALLHSSPPLFSCNYLSLFSCSHYCEAL